MAKRKRYSETQEQTRSLIEKLRNSGVDNTLLDKAVDEVLSDVKEKTKAAREFTLDQALDMFNLLYEDYDPDDFYLWNMPDLPEFKTSDCFDRFIRQYFKLVDRSTEAACRIIIDHMLIKCLSTMQTVDNSDNRPMTPTKRSGVDSAQLHCELAFYHELPRPYEDITAVTGRIDHGIGFICKNRSFRSFHTLLFIVVLVEAKRNRSVNEALAQLVVYLACIRQSRAQRGRKDTSVYGLASDGVEFKFVMISSGGIVRATLAFNISRDRQRIMGFLKYILEKTASMSPNTTPEKKSGGMNVETTDGDESVRLDHTDMIEEDEEEDEDD